MSNITLSELATIVRTYNHMDANHVEIINQAVANGYVVKLSVTQVQFTDESLGKAKRELPSGDADNKISVGKKVVRINSGNDTGNTGEVVEINSENTRARVRWGHSGLRTWVNFKFLSINR